MKQHTLFLLAAAAVPAMAELPPDIPSGPVTYDSVSYQDGAAAPDTFGTDTYDTPAAYDTPATYDTPAAAPQSAASSEKKGHINLNAYSTNYQVRGMGVTDALSHHGFSSVDGSFIFPNRDIAGIGLQFRVGGTAGVIWDKYDALGDAPMFNANCAIGKELFPNLTAEIGYALRYGGLEGYMARFHDGAPHRVTQDVNLSLSYDDHQRGFFGHLYGAAAFQGLNGLFFDAELGYRFADLMPNAAIGTDIEISGGVAPSFSYWGKDVDGIDAYRVKIAVEPFSRNGAFGRDARMYVRPWVQTSWSGSNAKKIDRITHYGPIDHFQITVGIDLGCRF